MATATEGVQNVSHLPQILAIQTLVIFLAILSVSLRLYVRIKMIKSLGRDDWCMMGAALCSIGTWILYIYKGAHGVGRHDAYISAEDSIKLTEADFWQVILSSALGMALLKISIALNLLRLSPSKWYSWCLWASIVFVAAYSFMAAMTFFLYCRPMQAYWDTSIKNAKCYSINLFITFALINTAFNIFTDVLFAVLPIPIIWKLQMKTKVRLYLIGVLSLGYTAVAFGITTGIYQIAYSSAADQSFNDSIMFFAILQVNTGMIAACVPSVKPLVSKALKLSDYTGSTSRRYTSHNNRYGSRYASQSRSAHWPDPYDLQELHSNEQEPEEASTNASASATATYHWSSSEERILSEQNGGSMAAGIIKTTEINVQEMHPKQRE